MKKIFHSILLIFLSLTITYKSYCNTYYSKANGNWGLAATWGTVCGSGTGAVPTAADNVIICAGNTVTMNVNGAVCLSLTINGTATWANARTTNVGAGGLIMNGGTITGTQTGTLNVAGTFTTSLTNNIGRCNLTISGTSTISSTLNITSATGTKTFSNLIVSGTFNNATNSAITINGNLQNNGTYTVGTGQVTFGGATSNTITGTSTTAFTSLRINKGTSNVNVLDVQSLITLTAGGLTLTNGTFELSNSSITISPFIIDITAAPYRIPATAGLWCNGATINSGNFNWSVAGLIRISAGTINLGNTSDNRLLAINGGTTQLIIEGGTFNIAGRISRMTTADNVTFTMSGGTINVPTVGCTVAGIAPVMMDQAGSSFTMSGGTIIILRAGAGNLGFTATAGTVGITGGTIQFGDVSTPASQTMLMNSTFPIANLSVNSTNATCQLAANLTVLQSININSGTLNANNLNITLGNSWTNSSTFTPGTGTLTLNGTGTQTITKAAGETFYKLTVNKVSGTVLLANNLVVNNTLTMTSGNIDCGANTLTLGISTASTGTLTYTAGTIIGNMTRWVNSTGVGILFPVGTSSYYRPALLTYTNLVGGTLTAKFVSSDPGANGLPLTESGKTMSNQYSEGYWDFTAANGLSSTNYAIELTGNGFTSYIVASSTRLLCRTSAVNPWTLSGAHVAGSGSTAKRSAVSGATAQFGFGNPSCSTYSAVSVTGSTSVCTNAAGTAYSVTNTPGNTYTWVITGGTQASGGTTNAITINWGPVGMIGSVQVTEKNDCGDDNTALILTVYVNPITTSAITGLVTLSTNQTGVAYSVTNTPGYTYTWSIIAPAGGTIASGQGTNAITINWGAAAGTYTVRVDVTRPCGAADFQTLAVTLRNVFYSRVSGPWLTAGTWSTSCGGAAGVIVPGVNDEVIICPGNIVTMNGNPGACRKLTINGTAIWAAVLNTNVGSDGIIINSTGDIAGTFAGILTSTGGLTLNSNANITSTTVIVRLQTTPQNISSSGTPGSLNRLDITTTATNTGILSIANNGTLSGAGTLTQGVNSTLTMNGNTFTLTTFNASATGNTVEYGANTAQTIRAGTYHHLKCSTTGATNIKTLGGAITANGNIDIAGVTLDVSATNYAIAAAGNWTNTGTFNARFGTVTFNGNSAQTISKSGGETFNNLVFNGSGTKDLFNPITVNFDMTIGSTTTINTNGNAMDFNGNVDNSGIFNPQGNNVTFSNNSIVMGSGSTTFDNVTITGTLTGHSSNFNVTGDWLNNGTFNHNNGTVTFDGTTTISGSSTNTFKNIDITGTLTAPLAGNINIAGNFNNSGVFAHNDGLLTFSGSSAQTISGTTITSFNDMTLNNSAGLSLTSPQNLVGTLTLTAGTFATAGGQPFTLISDINGTARIASIPAAGADLTGSITMQRFVTTGSSGWIMLGCAVTGATLQQFDDDFATGGFPGSQYPSVTGSNIVSYNESALGTFDNGWADPTNITDPMVTGKGYSVYILNPPFTVDITGPISKGDIFLPVTYTDDPAQPATEDGWNVVSNPYASAIDWDDVSHWTKTNIGSAIYMYSAGNDQYSSYIGGVGTFGQTKDIASSQSFLVQATGAAPVLKVTELAKTIEGNPFVRSSQAITDNILKLHLNGNGYRDETIIRFNANATLGFDNNLDARKFYSGNSAVPNLATIAGTLDMTINSLPLLENDINIPVIARVGVSGTYTLHMDSTTNMPGSSCLLLEDLLTHTFTDLRTSPSYSFYIMDTTVSPRFILHLGKPIQITTSSPLCTGSATGVLVAAGNGSGPWDYTWKDASGNIIQTHSNVSGPDILQNCSAGSYTIIITGNNGLCNGLLTETIELTDPLAINAQADVQNASCIGTADGGITLTVDGGTAPYSYSWSNGVITMDNPNILPGTYSITVTDSMGCFQQFNYDVIQDSAHIFGFSVSTDTVQLSINSEVIFTNTSSGGTNFSWDFGDGSPIEYSENATHSYLNTGTYNVSLSRIAGECSDTMVKQIVVVGQQPDGINQVQEFGKLIKVATNENSFELIFDMPDAATVSVEVFNSVGQRVFDRLETSVYKNKIVFDFLGKPNGIYFITIQADEQKVIKKILKM